MPDLAQLRRLSGEVRPPAFESLERVARRRDRRAAVAVALASVAAVVAVVAGAALLPGGDRPDPAPLAPTPSPTAPDKTQGPSEPAHASDTSMRSQEVVLADDAALELTGISADDPNFRFSKWRATCHWCPVTEIGRPTFTALAITTDGYETTTFRRAPFDSGLEQVISPGPGLLLVVDQANGYEWLVRRDGTVTALSRDFADVPATDARRWFLCLGNTAHTGAGGAVPSDAPLTWCVLDPDADVVHVRNGPWEQRDPAVGVRPSVVSPEGSGPTWGFQDQVDDRLIAWWLSGGTRHTRDLGASTENGAVLNAPPGTMAYWSWLRGSDTLRVFTSDDQGSTWRTTDLGVTFRPDGYHFGLSFTPGGALVGRQDRPTESVGPGDGALRLWRAELARGGRFEKVYETSSGANLSTGYPVFTVLDRRIWTSRLWSDDDGETWHEEDAWR